jgi:DNA anti-recombination protein RmuC
VKNIDGELQTLVYENYNKFIAATDIIKSIKNNMSDLDSELKNLKTSMNLVNSSYQNIDNRLKYKWKEIRKLDTLETDLSKLKNLGDLPDAFKAAIALYEESGEVSDLEGPMKQYLEYKDVLN